MEEVIGLVTIVMALFIPIYAIRRQYNQKDEKIKLQQLDKEHEIELTKQENYLLENKQMRLELEKIKEEREKREKETFETSNNKRWLIEDKDDSAL